MIKKILFFLAGSFLSMAVFATEITITGEVKSIDLSISTTDTTASIGFENCTSTTCPTNCAFSSSASNEDEMLGMLLAAKLRHEQITVDYDDSGSSCHINYVVSKR